MSLFYTNFRNDYSCKEYVRNTLSVDIDKVTEHNFDIQPTEMLTILSFPPIVALLILFQLLKKRKLLKYHKNS